MHFQNVNETGIPQPSVVEKECVNCGKSVEVPDEVPDDDVACSESCAEEDIRKSGDG